MHDSHPYRPRTLKIPPPLRVKRSSKWPKVRKEFLTSHPHCAICDTVKRVVAHHIIPVHINPELELVKGNLISLCENPKTIYCHFTFGHLGDWICHNDNVVVEASLFNEKIRIAKDRAYPKTTRTKKVIEANE
jgi:hypothetical protein